MKELGNGKWELDSNDALYNYLDQTVEEFQKYNKKGEMLQDFSEDIVFTISGYGDNIYTIQGVEALEQALVQFMHEFDGRIVANENSYEFTGMTDYGKEWKISLDKRNTFKNLLSSLGLPRILTEYIFKGETL